MAAPAKSQLPTAPTGRFLTRIEAADLLGCSTNTILNYEKRGKLVPQWFIMHDELGRARSAPLLPIDQVLKLPRRDPNPVPENPDELAARAFELLDKGKTVKQLVIELRATPEKMKRIHGEWLELSGPVLEFTGAHRGKLGELVGDFESLEELIELVAARIGRP